MDMFDIVVATSSHDTKPQPTKGRFDMSTILSAILLAPFAILETAALGSLGGALGSLAGIGSL